MNHKDTIYRSTLDGPSGKFQFDEKVAKVFDDMAVRSVPHYRYQQELVAKLACHFHQPGTAIVDLGCATGNTFMELLRFPMDDARFIGVDASQAMLDQAKAKCPKEVEFVNSGLEDVDIKDASVVIMLYTLQFLPFSSRTHILKKIYDSLPPKGCLILCEKLKPASSDMKSLFEKVYEGFKEGNDYSSLEIAQKKKALKDVLTPATMEENLNFLSKASFEDVEIFFKALHFCGFLAVKRPRNKRPRDDERKNRGKNGAGEGIRTLDFNLGKVALYH